MNQIIRKFELGDIDCVYNLGIQIPQFSANDSGKHVFWPKDTLERFVRHGFSFVIESETDLVGFLLAVYQQVTRKLTWENMYILPEYRKQGLAEECFQQSWKLAQEQGATVAESLVESHNTLA